MALLKLVLQMNLNELGAETVVFKRFDDSLLVFAAKCFDGYTQLYGSVAVGGNELVMIEAHNITVAVCYGLRNTHQFAGAVGEQHGNSEDAVALNQAMLYHGSHRDYVHVATRKNGNDFLALEIKVL